jgi:hypothetical protein
LFCGQVSIYGAGTLEKMRHRRALMAWNGMGANQGFARG